MSDVLVPMSSDWFCGGYYVFRCLLEPLPQTLVLFNRRIEQERAWPEVVELPLLHRIVSRETPRITYRSNTRFGRPKNQRAQALGIRTRF